MEPVNVVSAYRLEEALRRRIAAVDRRVVVRDISGLFQRELRWAGEGRLSGGERETLYSALKGAEVLLFPRPPKVLPLEAPQAADLLARSPALRWVHYVGAGLNHFNEMGLWQLGATITNSSGVAAVPIAEHVLYLMLMLVRQAAVNLANKAKRRWEKIQSQELRGKTLGVVGLGHIGQEVARLAKALGMQVLATRRSARPGEALPNVDRLYLRQELRQMLGASDFVLLSLPLTPETRQLIGRAELQAMKPGAYLLNVARGALVDEPALIQALEEGWIAGAGLDVFTQEPLPPESRLWALPNTVITCHDSNHTGTADARIVELFSANLERYLAGQSLSNLVDQAKGY
jgi:phosphoglycerate dehydrogenase-like enzyme